MYITHLDMPNKLKLMSVTEMFGFFPNQVAEFKIHENQEMVRIFLSHLGP